MAAIGCDVVRWLLLLLLVLLVVGAQTETGDVVVEGGEEDCPTGWGEGILSLVLACKGNRDCGLFFGEAR